MMLISCLIIGREIRSSPPFIEIDRDIMFIFEQVCLELNISIQENLFSDLNTAPVNRLQRDATHSLLILIPVVQARIKRDVS